jgi:hypothetical protein
MVATNIGTVQPEDFLDFYELDEFVDDWESLGFDRENDLWMLQILIMLDPEAGKVVAGTGGLRKLRFGKAGDRIGKRGGVRVCYVHFKHHAVVLLVAAYGKNEKDDLTSREKKYIREYIDRSKAWLDHRKM